jgi:hypothetical protein
MVKLFLSTPWRHTAGVEVSLYPFLTSALDGGEWSTSRTVRVTPGKEPGYPLNSKVAGPQNGSGRFWRTFVRRLLRTANLPLSRRLRFGRITRAVKQRCVNTLWRKNGVRGATVTGNMIMCKLVVNDENLYVGAYWNDVGIPSWKLWGRRNN